MEPVVAPRTFSNRYEVTHLIERGGMAQVYRARDTLLGRPVALKVMFPELSVDPAFVERFRREAQAAANLSHPNIVAIYDWGEDEGTYFIVMELITGRSLAKELREEKTIAPVRAASIAAQVASALSYAHRNRVVHRDIKPGNVLLTDDGEVKVTDFGIAQAVSTEEGLTMAGSVMGTAAYFSPEQAEGALVDGRSDIYSLGVVLYEMLAGRPPFVGDSPVAVASMHVRNQPPMLRDLNPAVPVAIEQVTMRALAKAPGDRYQSADEFRADLLRFADGVAVLAGVGGVAGAATGATSVIAAAGATSVMGAQRPPDVVAPVAVMDGPVRGVAPKKRSTTAATVVAIVLVLALIAAGLAAYKLLSGPGTVTVPNVTGETVHQAEAAIKDAGLVVSGLKSVSAPGVAQGHVVGTDPAVGTALKPNAKVTIEIPTVPIVMVAVPAVTGLSASDAESVLQNHKLDYVLEPVSQWTSYAPAGTVVNETPIAGTMVKSGSPITLSVFSTGGTFPVPSVANLTPGEAGATLGEDGLSVGTTTSTCSNSVAQGDVISTNPAAGQYVPAGTVVNLTTSSGACPVTVPNVQGLTWPKAQSQLTSASLDPQAVYSTCEPPDTQSTLVTSQDPAAFTTAAPGSPVTVTFGCVPPSQGAGNSQARRARSR